MLTFTKRHVKRNGYSAILTLFDRKWHVASCSDPCLGSLPNMMKYKLFIDTVLHCGALLNLQQSGASLTDSEMEYLHTYLD